MYITIRAGYTMTIKEIRQHKNNTIRQQIFTYLIHVRKEISFIDTRFFTVSTSIKFAMQQATRLRHSPNVGFAVVCLIACESKPKSWKFPIVQSCQNACFNISLYKRSIKLGMVSVEKFCGEYLWTF